MSTSAGSGNTPVFNPDGSVIGPICRDIMADPRQQLTLREGVMQGIGKAHRSVTYAHFDFRNFRRSYLGTQGRVT